MLYFLRILLIAAGFTCGINIEILNKNYQGLQDAPYIPDKKYRTLRNNPYIPKLDPYSDNSRIVFQYNGLLEADQFGGYKKVIKSKIGQHQHYQPEPQKIVTWTPGRTEAGTASTKVISTKKTGLVTWVPKLVPITPTSRDNKVIIENNRVKSVRLPSLDYKKNFKQKQANVPYRKESVPDLSQKSSSHTTRQLPETWTPRTLSQANKRIRNKQSLLIKPKNIFYNNFKSEVPRDLVWNGEQFLPKKSSHRKNYNSPELRYKNILNKYNPIPLSDVVPTSMYATDSLTDQILTKEGPYKSSSAFFEKTSPSPFVALKSLKGLNLNIKTIKVLREPENNLRPFSSISAEFKKPKHTNTKSTVQANNMKHVVKWIKNRKPITPIPARRLTTSTTTSTTTQITTTQITTTQITTSSTTSTTTSTTTPTTTSSTTSSTTSTTTSSTTLTATSTTTSTTTTSTLIITTTITMTSTATPATSKAFITKSTSILSSSEASVQPTTPSLIDQIKNIVYNTKDVKPTANIPTLTVDKEYLNLIKDNLTRNSQIDLKLPIFRTKQSIIKKTKNQFPYSFKPTMRSRLFPKTTTPSNQITINLLDWLASKSKLRTQKQSEKKQTPETTTQMQTIVQSINGDVFKYIEDSLDKIHADSETLKSESSLQVTMPNITKNHEDLISNDIIYYDHELTAESEDMVAEPSEVKFIVYPSKGGGTDTFLEFINNNTAAKDVFEHEDHVEVITSFPNEVTDEQIEDVMNHNTKLVGILKNTLEMQAFLFDKLFSYLF